MKRIVTLCILVLCLFSSKVLAQISVDEKNTFSGTVFMDYYWMSQSHNTDIEGENGFWIRRVYLTYERELNEAFSTRLRLEMNSAGDFESDPEMTPSVKDAYLKWQNDHHQILAGISSTPTWGLVEDMWGYRSVEKSPLDLHDFGSSRDFGLSFKGDLSKSGKLNYHFFIGNGNSNKPEVDKGKKFMLSLGYNITDHLVVEGYVDFNDASNQPDSYVAQLFTGYKSEEFTVGALGAYRDSGPLNVGNDFGIDLVSAFARASLSEKTNIFLRADHMFEPYPNGSENAYIPFAEGVESTFLVGGVDVLLANQIHLIPNIEAVVYGENAVGATPDTDLIPRVTLFFEF